VTLFLIIVAIIFYRWRYSLFKTLFRRHHGYWFPRSVDILLVGWSIIKLSSILLMISIIVNWPQNVVTRVAINSVDIILVPLVIAGFLAGVVVHIPPGLMQGSNSNDGSSQRDNINTPFSSGTDKQATLSSYSYLIWVPSASVIYRTITVFSVISLISSVSASIWIVKAIKTNSIQRYIIGDNVHSMYSSIVAVVFIAVCGYYCYGLYRISNLHMRSSYGQHPLPDDERNAIRYLFNILLAIMLICMMSLVFTIIAIPLEDQFILQPWTQCISMVVEKVILYPSMQCSVLYNVFLCSKAQVRRLHI
jgi:hypothetical protein